MVQKVFRAGNSNVVAIPRDLSEELQLLPGREVIVEKIDKDRLLIKRVTKDEKKRFSPDNEFKRWWKMFLKDNAGVLDELAIR